MTYDIKQYVGKHRIPDKYWDAIYMAIDGEPGQLLMESMPSTFLLRRRHMALIDVIALLIHDARRPKHRAKADLDDPGSVSRFLREHQEHSSIAVTEADLEWMDPALQKFARFLASNLPVATDPDGAKA